MKEMIKQKMMKRLHRRNSSSSSTASNDYSSGDRIEFIFSGLQALQVPKGWDKLSLSLISVETGKAIAKTGRASAHNGTCRWTETLTESIRVPHHDASKELEQCLYKLLISMGSGRSGILGEVTVNLLGHLSSDTSTSIAQPLKNCSHGTILQVEIKCLTPRANLRNDEWRDTDSFTEDANASDDLNNTSDVSDGRINKSVGSSRSSNFMYASQAGGLDSRERSLSAGGSHRSSDSMDDSFGRESCSPRSNLSEIAKDLLGRQDSVGSSNGAHSSYHVYDSPRSSHSPYSSGSGKHVLSQRQDSGRISHFIPASPLRTSGSSEFFLEAEGATVEEVRAEARMWERNARKLRIDLDFSRKESRDQTRNLENATMEVLALQTECDGLQHEINHLKVLLDESTVKEQAADSLKLQVQDKDDIQTELEEEIKFQKELNDNLSMQLNKTQESNLELVSVLQELEETIEKQRLEIVSLSALRLQDVDTGMKSTCKYEDNREVYTREKVSDKEIRAASCDSDYTENSIKKPTTDFLVEENDHWNPELQPQHVLESQKSLGSTILYLEKILEERTREIELEQALKAQTLLESESEWTKKLSLKDEEIFNLEEKLSEAHAAQVPKSRSKETPDVMEEVKALKDKIQELERDCNELTDENLELLFKLKGSSKDLSASITSVKSSLGGHPGSKSPSIEDSEVINLECHIEQLKEEEKKKELDGIDAGYLQICCNDVESKCTEIEVNIQHFKDKACYLEGELNKHHAKKEQENEIAALKHMLKLQQEGKHADSFAQEEQAEVILDNLVQLNRSLGNPHVAKDNVQHGEGTKPYNVENEIEDTLEDDRDNLAKLNMELKSRVQNLGKELLAKASEIEVLKSDCLLKDKEIQSQRCCQRDLETQLSDLQRLKSQLKGSVKAMQSESTIISECLDKVKTDMVVLNGTKDSQIAANKILEKKLLELESCNKELELHLAELEEENLRLSERVFGLEPQLRYLTDARESSRLEIQHSGTCVVNLQDEIRRLEKEIKTSQADMRQKLQEMGKRWLEAQEECGYLKQANVKLQSTAENLIEESTSLQKSNRELRQQRLDLYNRCTVQEVKLGESQHNFSKLSRNLEDLGGKFSWMVDGIATKERMFDSELDALHLQNKEQAERLVTSESLLNQMYWEKMVEIEKLQQEVAHFCTQISATHDERDRMSSEAVLEMHVLRADKGKLEKAIEDVKEKFRSSEKKLDTLQVEYEARSQELTDDLAASKQNHGILAANLEKAMELLENSRSNEEKVRVTVGELGGKLKDCEYQRVQLTEEISSLKGQLQKIPMLQDEVVALKNSLNDVKYENERLESSLQSITGDYEELKQERTSLLQKTSSMHEAVIELEDHKRSKVALEEQIMRLQGDITATEALCAHDAELKNELGRLKRSNSQLQRKINHLQEEKEECMKNAQAFEEKLGQKKGLKSDEFGCSTNNSAKAQIKSFLSEGEVHRLGLPLELEVVNETINKEHDKDASLLEAELKELQERYLHMSLKYAEVEAQREELVFKLKAVRLGRNWFS